MDVVISGQFLRFIVVGVFATIVNYLVFLIALHYFELGYLIASAIGFVSGIFAGFFFNKNWTFEAKNSDCQSVIFYYFVVYMISLVISLVFLRIVVGLGLATPEIANILAICITTCTNFIGVKFFVFNK